MNSQKPFNIGLLLAAIAALVVVLLSLRNSAESETEEKPAQEAVRTSAPVPATPLPPRSVPDPAAESVDDSPGERNAARPEAGTGENQLEHMIRSVVNANAEQLNLTPAQIDQLANDYLEFQEVHAELALRFLQETSFDPASVTLRLPAYPVEGKILRDMFYRRLETDFPGGKAEAIRENLGGFFDNAFRGFGVTEQTFTVTRNAELPNAFEVQWEARTPADQPAGTLNPEVSFAGSSGTLLLYREQLESGEFRFLGPTVERRFPDVSGDAGK